MVREEEEDKASPSEHGEDRQDKEEGSGSELLGLSAQSETRVDNSVDKDSQEVESPHEDVDTLQGRMGEEPAKKRVNFVDIPHFDSVSDPSDHHYVGESAQVWTFFTSLCRSMFSFVISCSRCWKIMISVEDGVHLSLLFLAKMIMGHHYTKS